MGILTNELPIKKDDFLAEVEMMDLSSIKNKVFAVAVATGKPDGVKFLSSTIHGPYSFLEMVQEVGNMWADYQHHAKAIVLDKESTNKVTMLDANTIDYIECHYIDIITEEMLNGSFDDKDFTCQAGLLTEEESTDPRHNKEGHVA